MTKLKQISVAEPEISLAYLSDIADGSKEFMVEMIDIFLKQTPDYLQELETGIAHQDWSTVAEIAHKIKPTFTFIGVEQATEAMSEIEKIARSGNELTQIATVFQQVKPLTQGVFSRLANIRKELAD